MKFVHISRASSIRVTKKIKVNIQIKKIFNKFDDWHLKYFSRKIDNGNESFTEAATKYNKSK